MTQMSRIPLMPISSLYTKVIYIIFFDDTFVTKSKFTFVVVIRITINDRPFHI